jgi:hypothetical protein
MLALVLASVLDTMSLAQPLAARLASVSEMSWAIEGALLDAVSVER